jgi:hypothetical protein
MDHHRDPYDADVQAVYDSQARLTRKVGRGLLVFAIVWVPALVIVPKVFKQGAIASGLLATTAAIVVMIILERYWLAPRDRERVRRSTLPPPPGQAPYDPAGGIEGLIERLSGRFRR